MRLSSRMKKVKEKDVDSAVSGYVRRTANWQCEYGKFPFCNYGTRTFYPPTNLLTCSHFHGRNLRSVRFDLENLAAFCRACHRYLEGRKTTSYKVWMGKRLGKKKFLA